MRRRPSVPPEGEAAAIDIRICMCIEIMRDGVDASSRKYECPDDKGRRACRVLALCFTWRQ
jgi:hypothetical protein